MKSVKVSIVMPCLNEAQTLKACIAKAQGWLQRALLPGEVVIADNGSTDGSQEIARAHGARVVHVRTRGYGAAIFHGVMAARGDYIIVGDSDDSYDFSQLDAFFQRLECGDDLVMGNRFLGGIAPGAMPWKNRYIGNPVLTWIGRALFGCPVGDFHCGLRAFRKDAFLRMDLRTTGMEFASEMVIKACLFGMKVSEVPTTLGRDGRSRAPHLRPWRDGWRHLRFMMLFSPHILFMAPGLVSLVCSLSLYLAVLAGPVSIGRVTLDIHTLYYAQAGVTLSVLALALGVMVWFFGMREGLMPRHRLLSTLGRYPILEGGVMLSLLIVGCGVYLGFQLVAQWGALDFGTLRDGQFMRAVSSSTLLITLGGIGSLVSLIMGFLALPLRPASPEGP